MPNAEHDLLRRYIAFVGDCEGTDFLYGARDGRFSVEEWALLHRLGGHPHLVQPEGVNEHAESV